MPSRRFVIKWKTKRLSSSSPCAYTPHPWACSRVRRQYQVSGDRVVHDLAESSLFLSARILRVKTPKLVPSDNLYASCTVKIFLSTESSMLWGLKIPPRNFGEPNLFLFYGAFHDTVCRCCGRVPTPNRSVELTLAPHGIAVDFNISTLPNFSPFVGIQIRS